MKRYLLIVGFGVAAIAVSFAAGAILARPVLADPKGDAPAATASPVVAAFPFKYDTEYEPDPFNTSLLRRARTTVTNVLVVHADGTQEIKACSTK
jgi:hypothetical protein